jgi:hypothetical protein
MGYNLQSSRHTLSSTVVILLWWFLKGTSSPSSKKFLQRPLYKTVMLSITRSLKEIFMLIASTYRTLDLSYWWWATIGSVLNQETLFGTPQAPIRCVVYLCDKMNWTSSYLGCLCFKDTTWRTIWLSQWSLFLRWQTLLKVSLKVELFSPKTFLLTLKANLKLVTCFTNL